MPRNIPDIIELHSGEQWADVVALATQTQEGDEFNAYTWTEHLVMAYQTVVQERK